jgi:PKD repeat protein
MKKGARLLGIILFVSLLPFSAIGQGCIYLTNISDFKPDQLCSPVEVIYWDVTYTGVDNGGTPVTIHYNWDDGSSETQPTTESPTGTFYASASHTYVSKDLRCNYHAEATLVVNGEMCEASTVEKIVTVWDVDNMNGAYVNARPNVYPICIGNGATMRFDDDTKYNCVPPQEDDIRNESTRWIQWVYGTSNSMSSLTPVSVDGYTGPWPYTTPVITLPGPIWGSDERSLPITVADDNQIGEEFQVELRYWNYCNKYTDGKPPVIDRSVIRIVDLPDPTITPVAPLCEYNNSIILTAASGGGTWSGTGITDGATGEFSPSGAGPGTHEIRYEVTDGNSCYAEDTVLIVVNDAPEAIITPVDPLCSNDPPYDLEVSPALGTWSGTGITNPSTGVFDPVIAGIGSHEIIFNTDPDPWGCFGSDTTTIHVMELPFAEFITPDSAWCEQATNNSFGQIVLTGTDSSTYDLVINMAGSVETITNLPADTFDILLNNQQGVNEYILMKVTEHHGNNSCETDLADTLVMTVNPIPEAAMTLSYGDPCSPVMVQFESEPGFKMYTWDFGEGEIETPSHQISQLFTYDYTDNMIIVGQDTTYDLSRDDSVFIIKLKVETQAGCVDSVTESVTVYPVPDADFFVHPVTQHYPDTTVFLTNLTSPGNWSYLWDYGDGSLDDVEEPGEHDYFEYGKFDIELKVFSPFCRDSIARQIQIFPPPPIASFWPDTIGCPPLLVSFHNESRYADSYIWDFDDGLFSTEKNPTHVFFQDKEHHVKLAVFGLSGTDTTEMTVTVYEPSQAEFRVFPEESRNLKQIFKFKNLSINASYYLWDFGDGNTSAGFEPEHTYDGAGTYTVTLYSWSKENCVDTLVREDFISLIAGEGSSEFPTAFVWNGSGPSGGHWDENTIDNTVFHPAMVNAKKLKLVIYTRWGEKIFESNEVYVGWDGYMADGNLAKEGVYFYRAWITYVDGTESEVRGDITFLY